MNGTRITILGSFTVGEVPPTLEYQYLDSDGVAISLAGYGVAQFHWASYAGGSPVVGPFNETASISDALNGRVTYSWDGDEFATPGRYLGQFFVNNGTNQLASILIEWHVCAAVGTPPSV